MSEWVRIGNIQVAAELKRFIEDEALPGTGVDAQRLWAQLDAILNDLAPRNRALLATRDELQARIDGWYREQIGRAHV